MRKFLGATAIGLLVVATPVSAQFGSTSGSHGPLVTRDQLDAERRGKLRRVRLEALSRRAADGGELSAESKARLQREIDRIEADHLRLVRKYDPFAADAMGRSVPYR